ncbi:AAA family ATPase [Streptomyces sp. NEAU-H22]|uniref:AAA family ATPase n=1 Tax=unclassified Streptomyces TaxID=2593676 RepID=UPI00224F13CF|nr:MULTISPECIES: AAA family ATPase [unclassified Streptomyces]MCX3286838.1 AAA family ATPase [Streptomyces sp. NEAU-H22]WMD09319.1 AAA family ATPase [Streptomyces sp. FXY-T5]
MTVTEQPRQNAHHPNDPARPASSDQPAPVAALVEARLAEEALSEPVKVLLKEALGDGEPRGTSSAGRIYLESVAVARFRGIGPRAWLKLSPRPGVNLVVGRNGSGKSSIAEGIETAFTGVNMRWQGQHAMRSSNWRNLHDTDGRPEIEVKLAIEGDTGRSTLTRTWDGDDFDASRAELKRPGHGRAPLDQADWKQALRDFRPFLSYVDLDRMISGKPSEMYDAIATILGLGQLSAADGRLRQEAKALEDADKAAKAELPGLKEALYELEDDERAVQALVAVDTAGTPDFETVEALVAGLPADGDDGLLAGLRAEADVQGPETAQVRTAVDRLRRALADAEDLRGTGAEDALRRAELLERAVAHHDRHPDAAACPVCGTDGMLDPVWAADAIAQIAALRQEAEAAAGARSELRSAARAVQDLVHTPRQIPAALADPWRAWTACRTISDPGELAQRAHEAAETLADACAAVKENAVRELEKRDERWRGLVTRLAAWAERARAVEANKPRLRDIRKASTWIKALAAELREQRMEGFADQSQRIWERLRQESNIDLKAVSLKGSEKATVRKLVMDVTVDGQEASALSVMSQGEQHSLALSLFLPRAATADSPFGFIVIDDPVQSMDPAKVNGLAQVVHELGEHRQVVVFTHDTRLQRAFTSQGLPVTVFEVERAKSSKVKVKPVIDPVRQALDDARALATTGDLPSAARTHVLPSLCRIALENAFLEAAWIRHHRSGAPEDELQAAVGSADKLMKVAALALFGDAGRTGDVYRELRTLCGPRAVDLLKECQNGAHAMGARIADPHRFVDDIESMAQKVRKPGVTA